MKVEAIVPAAGLGLRLRSKTPKALVEIKHIPLIIHTLKALDAHPLIRKIILVVRKKELRTLRAKIRHFGIKKVKGLIPGGALRRDSVNNGIKYLDADTDLVIIHDGARPFVSADIITTCINTAKRTGACVAAVPVKPTIKRVKQYSRTLLVCETLKRRDLWEIQTPQVFEKGIILKAYRKFRDRTVTDDAALVERLGLKVAVARGSYSNIKITTPEDLLFAEAIAAKRAASRE